MTKTERALHGQIGDLQNEVASLKARNALLVIELERLNNLLKADCWRGYVDCQSGAFSDSEINRFNQKGW